MSDIIIPNWIQDSPCSWVLMTSDLHHVSNRSRVWKLFSGNHWGLTGSVYKGDTDDHAWHHSGRRFRIDSGFAFESFEAAKEWAESSEWSYFLHGAQIAVRKENLTESGLEIDKL